MPQKNINLTSQSNPIQPINNNTMTLTTQEISKRFTQLSLLDDKIIKFLYGEMMTKRGNPPPPGKVLRKRMLRAIAEAEEVHINQNDKETSKDDGEKADAVHEIITEFPNIFNDSNYTLVSWKRFIDLKFNIPDDELLFLTNPHKIREDMTTFIDWVVEKAGISGPDDFTKDKVMPVADEALKKFKKMFFYTMKTKTFDSICINMAADATSVLANANDLSGKNVQFLSGYAEMVRRVIQSLPADVGRVIDDDERGRVMDYIAPQGGKHVIVSPDLTPPPPTPPAPPTPPTPPAPPAEADPNEVVLDVEEAVIQTTADEVVPDVDAHLSLKVLPYASLSVYKQNFDLWKQVPINQISAYSWRKCRETHNLGGRCSVFIARNPLSKKQNKCFKYKEAHLCDASYEDCEDTEFGAASMYPYGEVICVRSVD
tara:strand:+ start:58 stop:1341 length:1284 start_codon:yes stop_codon:yes gene_type:complete